MTEVVSTRHEEPEALSELLQQDFETGSLCVAQQQQVQKFQFLSGWFLSGSLSAPVIMCPMKMLICLDLESDGQNSITSGSVQIENM